MSGIKGLTHQPRKFKRDEKGVLMQRCHNPECRQYKYLNDFAIRFSGRDEPYNRHTRCKDCVNQTKKGYAKIGRDRLLAIGLSCRKNPLGKKQNNPWKFRNKWIIERNHPRQHPWSVMGKFRREAA